MTGDATGEPPDDTPAPAGEESPSIWTTAKWVLVGFVYMIIGAAGYRLTSNDGDHDASLIDIDSRLAIYRLDAAQRWLLEGGLTESACHGVNYTVVGSADRVSITMQTPDGTEQSASEQLPYGRSVGCMGDDEVVAISVRNLGDTGDLTCEIRRGGKLVAQAESSGPYVLASCND